MAVMVQSPPPSSAGTVVMTRVNRTVVVTGPDNAAPPPAAAVWLEENLTYYERKFNFTASAESGSRYEVTPRKMYGLHPRAGHLSFPIGLRSRVARGLKERGYKVEYRSHPIADPDSPAAFLDWDGLLSEFKLFPGQDTLLSRVVAADNGVISATTGYGKSVCMRMICRLYVKAKIHVVTKSAGLADEIHNDLSRIIPGVGFVGAGRKKFGRVTVFVADSLHHGMGEADILLADELHELLAPTYAASLGRYTKTRMFGFSATPTGRADGRDILGEAIFGPVLYTIPYQEAQEAGRVVPITVEWLRVPDGPDVSSFDNLTTKERIGIWANDKRNEAIAARVRQFDPDEQVVVMVKTIDHAVRLKSLMPEFTLVYAAGGMDDERLRRYVRDGLLGDGEEPMTRERLRDIREQFAAGTLKKVIANYVWSTGVNFPHLAVLVRADAASSEIKGGQIPGRICRRVPGVKESALLVDVWDDWDRTFLERSRARRANYTKRGWASVFSDPNAAQVQRPEMGGRP